MSLKLTTSTADAGSLTAPQALPPWIISQIGSREHYAIPALLAQNEQLDLLLTDYWGKPSHLWEYIPRPRFRKLRQRNHPSIPGNKVVDQSLGRLIFDIRAKSKKASTWETTLHRNQWYQKRQLAHLHLLDRQGYFKNRQGIFFSYSYAALDLFKFFKQRGWINLLCQIDPGRHEENLVKSEIDKHPQYGKHWEAAPEQYWQLWKQELSLADRILVNSSWSQKALEYQGLSGDKIHILPLAYSEPEFLPPSKDYPDHFDQTTPLKVLFLGQINIRKGVHHLLQALKEHPNLPLQVDFVGPIEMDLPALSDPRINIHGPVSRQETEAFYQQAHLFILPTLSDGFAITQLEAQRWRLPILASRNCGSVVQDGFNGLLLPEISPSSILSALQKCLQMPDSLRQWSENSTISSDSPFSLTSLARNLKDLEKQLLSTPIL